MRSRNRVTWGIEWKEKGKVEEGTEGRKVTKGKERVGKTRLEISTKKEETDWRCYLKTKKMGKEVVGQSTKNNRNINNMGVIVRSEHNYLNLIIPCYHLLATVPSFVRCRIIADNAFT